MNLTAPKAGFLAQGFLSSQDTGPGLAMQLPSGYFRRHQSSLHPKLIIPDTCSCFLAPCASALQSLLPAQMTSAPSLPIFPSLHTHCGAPLPPAPVPQCPRLIQGCFHPAWTAGCPPTGRPCLESDSSDPSAYHHSSVQQARFLEYPPCAHPRAGFF